MVTVSDGPHRSETAIFVEFVVPQFAENERERERETATAEESLVRVWPCEFDMFLHYKTSRSSFNSIKHSRKSTYELL